MTVLVKYLWNNIAMPFFFCTRHVGMVICLKHTWLVVTLSSSAVSLSGNVTYISAGGHWAGVDLPRLIGRHCCPLKHVVPGVWEQKKAPSSHFMSIWECFLIFTASMIQHWCLLFYVHPKTMDDTWYIYPWRRNRLIHCLSWHKYHPSQNGSISRSTLPQCWYTWHYHLVTHDVDGNIPSIHVKYISNK